MRLGNVNICIYDSMLRDPVENHLVNQLGKMMTQKESDQSYIHAWGKKNTFFLTQVTHLL